MTHLSVSLFLPRRHGRAPIFSLHRRNRLEDPKLTLLRSLSTSSLDFLLRVLLAHIGRKGFSKPLDGSFEVGETHRYAETGGFKSEIMERGGSMVHILATLDGLSLEHSVRAGRYIGQSSSADCMTP